MDSPSREFSYQARFGLAPLDAIHLRLPRYQSVYIDENLLGVCFSVFAFKPLSRVEWVFLKLDHYAPFWFTVYLSHISNGKGDSNPDGELVFLYPKAPAIIFLDYFIAIVSEWAQVRTQPISELTAGHPITKFPITFKGGGKHLSFDAQAEHC